MVTSNNYDIRTSFLVTLQSVNTTKRCTNIMIHKINQGLTHRGVWNKTVHKSFLIKPTDALISQIYFVKKLYMFQTVSLPIIRSFQLYSWHFSFQAWPSLSCFKAVITPAWHIPVLNIQWKTPDDGQRNCQEHVEFLDNKFGKLVCLLVLLKRNLLWCMVTWK
jgi:hypothetical protein